MTFPIDEVLGAFAFTMSVPLILIGSGFGWHIPEWLSPAVTILIIGAFWWKSVRASRAAAVQFTGLPAA